METKKSMEFGGLDLRDYVNLPSEKLSLKRKKALEEKIYELGEIISDSEEEPLNVEEDVLNLVKDERRKVLRELRLAQYKGLDVSFLSMVNPVKYERGEVLLPRFGVYRYFDFGERLKGFDDFVASFWIEPYGNEAGFFFGNSLELNGKDCHKFGDSKSLIEVLARGTDFYRAGLKPRLPDLESYSPNMRILFKKIPDKLIKSLREKMRKSFEYDIIFSGISEQRFSTSFKGLIPSATKRKIQEAKNIFGFKETRFREAEHLREPEVLRRYNVFLIGEVESDAWVYESLIARDPLVVGKEGDNFYLVDKFNATPIEDYVSKEFSSG